MERTTLPDRLRVKSAAIERGARFRLGKDDGRARGDVEAAAVAVETFARDVEGFGFGEGVAAARCAAARAGRPEGFALFGWGGGDEDAGVVDFCAELVGCLGSGWWWWGGVTA